MINLPVPHNADIASPAAPAPSLVAFPQILIRRMGPDDAALMTDLEQHVFPADPWTPRMVAEELQAPSRYYICAELPAKHHPRADLVPEHRGDNCANSPSTSATSTVAGWAGIRLGEDADVMTIGVLPSFRGHHIGRTLLTQMVDYAKKAGACRIFLEVRASNVAAIHLYESLGFKRTGIIKRYFHHPTEDALTMRLILRGMTPSVVGYEISKDPLT